MSVFEKELRKYKKNFSNYTLPELRKRRFHKSKGEKVREKHERHLRKIRRGDNRRKWRQLKKEMQRKRK
jgi:hypothetical protein